mmetsp:Transcript_29464/g.78252  ORF Transcript_29464/g.78252 Transcript_29464/m.78252 type:complete len:302 (+) Transcript_29464:71-976(+)
MCAHAAPARTIKQPLHTTRRTLAAIAALSRHVPSPSPTMGRGAMAHANSCGRRAPSKSSAFLSAFAIRPPRSGGFVRRCTLVSPRVRVRRPRKLRPRKLRAHTRGRAFNTEPSRSLPSGQEGLRRAAWVERVEQLWRVSFHHRAAAAVRECERHPPTIMLGALVCLEATRAAEDLARDEDGWLLRILQQVAADHAVLAQAVVAQVDPRLLEGLNLAFRHDEARVLCEQLEVAHRCVHPLLRRTHVLPPSGALRKNGPVDLRCRGRLNSRCRRCRRRIRSRFQPVHSHKGVRVNALLESQQL